MGFFNFLFGLFGLCKKSKQVATPSPAPRPVSTMSLKAGIFLTPWYETPITLAALPDLHPGVIRINYPAFKLMTHNVSAQEADRLVGLIEVEIGYARSIGALPLIVTTLGTIAPATVENVTSNAKLVAEYYAGVAKRYPGCAWEIGNEAEIPSGGHDASLTPQLYASIFETHAYAIRSVDLTATLVTAGTSGFHYDWIRAVLALTRPDAVGVHPYGTAPQNFANAVATIGTNLPVWFTEWGLQDITPQQVSDYFSYAHGVVPVAVLFCLSDLSAEANQTFGIIDKQGHDKLSYAAAKTSFRTYAVKS